MSRFSLIRFRRHVWVARPVGANLAFIGKSSFDAAQSAREYLAARPAASQP